ncbi:MAG: hypothetical protein GEU82_15120 [Luteitalea sp.]|nr:hypothetical protein [Luteitalea sp.]
MSSSPTRWIAMSSSLFLAGLAIASGGTGLLYAPVYVLAIAPGILLGRRLVTPPAAGSIVGGVVGYGLVQLALWLPIFLGQPSRLAFGGVWLLLAAVVVLVSRRVQRPVLTLPAWGAGDLRALALTLLLVPLVMTPPYRNLGAADGNGTRWYRAYFTADFVWHTALAGELGRYDVPPRNPYLASQDLHYYWTYFLLPSVVAHEIPPAFGDVQSVLKANAVLSAGLFMGMFFLFARSAVPSGTIAAAALGLGVLTASAEGTLVLEQLWRQGAPLRLVEDMNIDAITNWQFGGLRVDNVPRSLWYTPQHAFACALGLVAALTVATAGAAASNGAIWLAGTALGLATCFNPLLGGVFSLLYGLGVVVDHSRQPRLLTWLRHAQAAIPVALALGWAALNEVAEGAGSAVTIGFTGFARRNTTTSLLLSVGPMLIPALAGLWPWRHLPVQPLRVASIGTVLALLLMHFVTLSEASWVGFRAGQILLLMLPVLLARPLWALSRRRRWPAAALALLVLAAGLPTTIIDTYNAQDISNRRQGPGFHWTLPVRPAQQEAFAWVRANLPEHATLQMEPMLRGREHWSLIPTFAQRRMAAGLPISLLPMREYDTASSEVERLYRTADSREGWQLAHGRGIQYLYVDREDRAAYPEGVAKFQPPYFERIFQQEDVEIYKVL